jgi:hypothetical protein
VNVVYPSPEYFANCFVGVIEAEKVLDNEEIFLMKLARRLMTDHVSLSCVIENRIATTETLKGTIRAARQ